MAEKKVHHNDHYFSKAVRAGRRTYFFDVKSTKKGDYYLTITESKRRFDNEQGKFFYEKFKIFLYKEDFAKFTEAMEESVNYIKTHNGGMVEDTPRFADNGKDKDAMAEYSSDEESFNNQSHSDVDFEDLGPIDQDNEKNDSTV